jgi:hypothetical protein
MYQGRLNRRTSEMGGVITVVKGKGVECEKCTDGIMKILHTICLKRACCFVLSFILVTLRRGRWRKTLLHDTAANDTTSYTNSRSTFYLSP